MRPSIKHGSSFNASVKTPLLSQGSPFLSSQQYASVPEGSSNSYEVTIAEQDPRGSLEARSPIDMRGPESARTSAPQSRTDIESDLEFLAQYVNISRDQLMGQGDDSNRESVDTSRALQRCQETVIRPLTWFLCLLAWQPFPLHRAKWLNVLYPLFICLLILYSYAYRIYVCTVDRTCDTMISEFIVPDLANFAAYMYAMVYFRYRQGFDQVTSLIDTVFLQSLNFTYQTPFGDLSQSKLLRTLRGYLACAFLWLILKTGFNVVLSVFIERSEFSTPIMLVTVFLQLSSVFVTDTIYVAVVVNYAIQSRLVMFYVDGLRSRLNQRQTPLSTALKEIMQIRRYVRALNKGLGIAVSLSVFMFTVLSLISFFKVGLIKTDATDMSKGAAVAELVIWLTILLLTLVNAGRLTANTRSLRDMAVLLRNEGYRNATPADLDSFLLFVANVRTEARVMLITITPSLLAKCCFVGLVTVMILFQLRVIKVWL
eukprot:Colp12_sorted_trinity150504_noHs@14343